MTIADVHGSAVVFIAEPAISVVLMAAVLFVSNDSNLARYTPYIVGALVAIYLSLEAPLSGNEYEPGANIRVRIFHPLLAWLWIYFMAPTIGMLIAAEIFLSVRGGDGPGSAKRTMPVKRAAYSTADTRLGSVIRRAQTEPRP